MTFECNPLCILREIYSKNENVTKKSQILLCIFSNKVGIIISEVFLQIKLRNTLILVETKVHSMRGEIQI